MATSIAPARKGCFVCALTVIVLISIGSADAARFVTLHRFKGLGDGRNPWSDLVADRAGNLYGTTILGGSRDICRGYRPKGCGAVFKLAPDGNETLIHVFSGPPDGAFPEAGLVADGNGNLYGTTSSGGAFDKGAVFEIAANGTEAVLYSFRGAHGENPQADLIIDGSGNLYGTTAYGGDKNCPEKVVRSGCGVVFKVTPNGKELVLHAFANGEEGNEPLGGLVADRSGNLFGMTQLGGSGYYGNIFKIAPDGTETVLYGFQGMPDGARPAGSLIMDAAGNLYGTTGFGGNSCEFSVYGCGVVFRLAPNGDETVLHAFAEGHGDGIVPDAGLVADAQGNLYGTTLFGGESPYTGYGTVFEVAADGAEAVLHSFNATAYEPAASLLLVKDRLYGTASSDDRFSRHRGGSVFELRK